MAEQAQPMGGGTESLTRQDRLLCVFVENFQPVWREIEEAGVFRRAALLPGRAAGASACDDRARHAARAAGRGRARPTSWADLAASRDADPDLARQFKRWMNALTEYFNGPGRSAARSGPSRARSDDTHPTTERTADTLAGELLARPSSRRLQLGSSGSTWSRMQCCGHPL